jgi:hypothetical protein
VGFDLGAQVLVERFVHARLAGKYPEILAVGSAHDGVPVVGVELDDPVVCPDEPGEELEEKAVEAYDEARVRLVHRLRASPDVANATLPRVTGIQDRDLSVLAKAVLRRRPRAVALEPIREPRDLVPLPLVSIEIDPRHRL